MRARKRGLALVVLIMLTVSSCGGDRLGPEEMELRVSDGRAQLLREGKTRVITGRESIERGDVVSLQAGGAELRLGQVAEVELSRRASVRVVSVRRVELLRGSVLAESRRPLTLSAGDVEATSPSGVFRLDRGIASRTASYTAEVAVNRASQRLAISAFFQAVVAQEVPQAPAPIVPSARDAWDQRYLGAAIDLDQRLANFARGLETQLGSDEGIRLFERVLPQQDVSFLIPRLGSRRSDLLIGVAVASDAAELSSLPLPERFDRVYDLWQRGASWGLISQMWGSTERGIFGLLLEAVNRAGISLGSVSPGAPQRAGRDGSQPSPAPDRSPSPGPRSPAPSPSPTQTRQAPLPSPVRSILPSPATGLIDDIFGTVPT